MQYQLPALGADENSTIHRRSLMARLQLFLSDFCSSSGGEESDPLFHRGAAIGSVPSFWGGLFLESWPLWECTFFHAVITLIIILVII
jgi:hypothetical protein